MFSTKSHRILGPKHFFPINRLDKIIFDYTLKMRTNVQGEMYNLLCLFYKLTEPEVGEPQSSPSHTKTVSEVQRTLDDDQPNLELKSLCTAKCTGVPGLFLGVQQCFPNDQLLFGECTSIPNNQDVALKKMSSKQQKKKKKKKK